MSERGPGFAEAAEVDRTANAAAASGGVFRVTEISEGIEQVLVGEEGVVQIGRGVVREKE